MKCLLKYQWVKLPRTHLPQGKGLMGYWARLASRAAFRKGQVRYCGHVNDVMPGMWSGGVVGLKSILGVKNRTRALEIMDRCRNWDISNTAWTRPLRSRATISRTGSSNAPVRNAWTELSTPPKATAFSAFPAASHSGWRSRITHLRNQTHGWISGAIPLGRIRAMRFLFLRRPSSTAPMAPH